MRAGRGAKESQRAHLVPDVWRLEDGESRLQEAPASRHPEWHTGQLAAASGAAGEGSGGPGGRGGAWLVGGWRGGSILRVPLAQLGHRYQTHPPAGGGTAAGVPVASPPGGIGYCQAHMTGSGGG